LAIIRLCTPGLFCLAGDFMFFRDFPGKIFASCPIESQRVSREQDQNYNNNVGGKRCLQDVLYIISYFFNVFYTTLP
jgi:hypothetical protein